MDWVLFLATPILVALGISSGYYFGKAAVYREWQGVNQDQKRALRKQIKEINSWIRAQKGEG